MKDKEPPKILVETWISLARNSEQDKEITARALKMLREKIGTPEDILRYMKKHNIK